MSWCRRTRSRFGRLAYATSLTVACRTRQRADVGPLLADDDLGLLELPQLVGRGLRVDRAQLVEVERDEERRGAPRELAQPRREGVEPRGHDGLHGRREGRPGGGRVGQEHAGRLDDEERVAAGAPADLGRLALVDAAARGLAHELDRLLLRERVEPELYGVVGAPSPRRAVVQRAAGARGRGASPGAGPGTGPHTRSISSSIGGRSVCASSNTSSTGCSAARPSISATKPCWTSWTNADSSRRSANPKSSASSSTSRSVAPGRDTRSTSSRSRCLAFSGGSDSSRPACSPTIAAAGANVSVSVNGRERPRSTVTSSPTPATSSSARRDLPMPGSPTTVTSTGRPEVVVRARLSRRIASSLPRPTNGIVRRDERVVSPSTGKPASSPTLAVEPLRRDRPLPAP